ncbi:stage II sporulation protein M [Natrialba aegyptia]|uniref:Stage II sporulation protein M n=1 Tax=Natrialba aegyptia DSM 13077 TaxID=1227491 RepID=M0B1I3_9EURY|nr:stage II sporulation protein M [Natrialba aegyptia]ELZ04093.1 hypothetical protein C480_11291 [Natrialba aegyptia DSM 13077]
MSLSDAVGAVVSVFRRRPSDLLPLYLLGAAAPAVVRVVPMAALLIGVLYLAGTSRLDSLLNSLQEMNLGPPPSDPESAAFEAWASQFEPLVDLLVTPATIALLIAAVFVSLVVVALLYAITSAAQLGACYGRVRDERGLIAGIAGARRYWLRILGLFILEFILWMVVALVVGIGTAVATGAVAVATDATALGIPVVLLGGLVMIALFALVRALFAFAPVAVVVDDAGVFGSLSKTAGFIRSEPIGALFYYALAVGSLLALSAVSGVLFLVDVVTFPSLLTMLVLLPAFDLLKTALYVGYRGRLTPPAPPDRSVPSQLRAGLGRGWHEMTAYVRHTPLLQLTVVALAVASFWVGWRAGAPLADLGVETSIAARLQGHLPPAAALEFFANNWLVAITTAFGGLALVLPTIASLVFNGVYMGFYAQTEAELADLVAFVLPHGIFEIPAIFIASAVGITLGLTGWRAFRGRTGRVAFADELERAFWVLVGVGLLLAIAAVIEGFVSPYYYDVLL